MLKRDSCTFLYPGHKCQRDRRFSSALTSSPTHPSLSSYPQLLSRLWKNRRKNICHNLVLKSKLSLMSNVVTSCLFSCPFESKPKKFRLRMLMMTGILKRVTRRWMIEWEWMRKRILNNRKKVFSFLHKKMRRSETHKHNPEKRKEMKSNQS